jgi:hypothetical protein
MRDIEMYEVILGPTAEPGSARDLQNIRAGADSAIASSGFRSVPTAAVRRVAASAPQALADSVASAADRAEAAAPAAVGDRNSASTLDCGYKLKASTT